jgi:hypothetical protein
LFYITGKRQRVYLQMKAASMRRFFALPAEFLLDATGFDDP